MHETFLTELQESPLSLLASKWILARVPHIFESDDLSYIVWKETLSEHIGVDSSSITFTGSASIGFSLNPSKGFRSFDDDSDVDIAIISQHYFDLSWHYLRSLGVERYQFTPTQQRSIEDHARRLIYWGTIATDRIIEILPFGKE